MSLYTLTPVIIYFCGLYVNMLRCITARYVAVSVASLTPSHCLLLLIAYSHVTVYRSLIYGCASCFARPQALPTFMDSMFTCYGMSHLDVNLYQLLRSPSGITCLCGMYVHMMRCIAARSEAVPVASLAIS